MTVHSAPTSAGSVDATAARPASSGFLMQRLVVVLVLGVVLIEGDGRRLGG
jgi:hypothetical protein